MTEHVSEDLRVLLVEDEMLVCMDIQDMLEEFGYRVVGPAAQVNQALELIEQEPIDLAVLDVNLGRETSYPIAERLSVRGIPFLFSTGYGEVDPAYRDRPRVQKPFSKQQLFEALRELNRSSRSAGKASN